MPSIMVVEDEGIVARDIQKRLTNMGYDVSAVVSSGEAALETAPRVLPDLVLMDIMLKGKMDGTEAAEQLYQQYHIPVVYLTAHADSATVQRAKATQPFGYVIKPFEERELQTSIEMALSKSKAETALRETNDVLEARVIERTAELEETIAHLQKEIDTRKRAEASLHERDDQLRQAQKMEAVGRLAGGVTHDFNNQLGIMKGYLDMAMDRLGQHHPVHAYLANIDRAVDRASGLTRQLLLFSSRQPVDLQVLNLNRQISEFYKLLGRLLGEDVTIALDLAEDLWTVRADTVNVDQVVTNLAVNARDAMPTGGTLTIRTRNMMVGKTEAKRYLGARPGAFVCVSVGDTGTGMPPEVLSRLFEPFFTTKAPGKGTGLGLAVVYGIVQSHGGWITVDSTPGLGTQFHIFLPACEAHMQAQEPVLVPKEQMPGQGECILLVEDDESLRDMFCDLLTSNGYRVCACGGVAEAQALLDSDPFIQLILSDVTLPDGRGTDLVLKSRAANMKIPALLITGYTEERVDLGHIQAMNVLLLQKPIAMDVLLKAVRQAVEHGRRA